MNCTPRTYIAVGFIAIGLLTIVLGFVLGGSPAQARREARDEQRTQGLSQINASINGHYTQKSALPSQSEYQEFYKNTSLGLGKSHPLLNEPPSYRVLTPTSYELCTTFESAKQNNNHYGSPSMIAPGPYKIPSESPDFWNHPAGQVCYSILINSYTLDEARRRTPAIPVTVSSTTP